MIVEGVKRSRIESFTKNFRRVFKFSPNTRIYQIFIISYYTRVYFVAHPLGVHISVYPTKGKDSMKMVSARNSEPLSKPFTTLLVKGVISFNDSVIDPWTRTFS
ncbi:ORF1094 [White spot syndrome virus]|uniref:ORF1094 n=1 Tax=White spot syndrome virus TaxID=342409 RepID=A0A2D3I5G5_9VIRU|nr:ORF1094 [White spot syndrome virus]